MKRPDVVLVAAIASFSGACVDDIQMTGDGGDTGGELPPDGVYINCLNENYVNYWWSFGPDAVPVQLFGAYPERPLNACIGPANMGEEFDLVADWDDGTYGYPAFDAEIRALCTERCSDAHKIETGKMKVCEDKNWSGHAVYEVNYDPAEDGATCNVAEVHFAFGDPYAGDIDWNEGIGSPLSLPLACSLLDDCADDFDTDMDEGTAAFHAVADGIGTSIALDMHSGSGPGFDDENLLEGHAEYSPSYCGHSTCPFYLAAFDAANGFEEWAIYLDIFPVVSEHKEISNVRIEMLQPTLAVWRPNTGQVAFPSGSLVFQVDFELSSDTCTGACSHFGDGEYSRRLTNPTVVFGRFHPSDGTFDLDYSFPIIGGAASLVVGLTADGHPPEAAMNLVPESPCTHADGYELTDDNDGSTDVDSDLDYTVWYVDGVIRSNGYVIALGHHTIDLLAVDDRGAHDFAGAQVIEVIQGPDCL